MCIAYSIGLSVVLLPIYSIIYRVIPPVHMTASAQPIIGIIFIKKDWAVYSDLATILIFGHFCPLQSAHSSPLKKSSRSLQEIASRK
jgi:hypothetical protein